MMRALAAGNPEFQRQLWLEFSPARLLGMPAVLALVFAAVGLASPAALPTIAQTGFVLLVGFYGARLASAALLDEVSEATWDAQRLSSLTPWQLTWGKLFGGTLFAWYGGALCLAVWLASSGAQGVGLSWALLVGMVAAGVGLQAVSLIVALAALRRGGTAARRGGAWWIVLLVVFPWFGALPRHEAAGVLSWWGLSFGAATFYAATAVVFAAWAVLGAQRLMAGVLQLPLRPFAWLGFQAWLAVFAAGFWPDESAVWRVAFAVTACATTTAYLSLFIEPPQLGLWQRFAARWRAGGALDTATLERLPLMLASLALALGGGLVASLLAPVLPPTGIGRALALAGLPLTWALLALRDLALACAIHWGPRARRAESTTLVVLVVLNLVLPWLLHAAGLHALAGLLQPLGAEGGGWLGAAIAALQAAGAVFVARTRWRPADRV
ncbi:hypothetical protein [Methylibium sp.]|uniref:hypothetical protein n=1 Tax=Methylibium sp. TaxID=2067992 RepID=UPI003D13F247